MAKKAKKEKYVPPENLLTEEEKERAAEENYNLVHSMINKYKNTFIDKDELYSCAHLGFTKALNSFDKKQRGTKLSTYICTCIVNEINFYLRYDRAQMRKGNTLSFDANILHKNEDSDLTITDGVVYRDVVKNGEALSYVEQALNEIETRETMQKMVRCMPEREQIIIIKSFGLFGEGYATQMELAEMLGMSQANVSKVKSDGLKRLGHIMEREARRALKNCENI